MSGIGAEYSNEQKRAVVRAYVPRKFTAEMVVAAAAAGELLDDDGRPLPAFEIPIGTIRSYKRRYIPEVDEGEPDEVKEKLEDMRLVSIEIAEHELREIRKLQRAGKPVTPAGRIAASMKVARELQALRDAVPPRRAAQPAHDTSEMHDHPSAVSDGVGSLMRDHRTTTGDWTPPVARAPLSDAPAATALEADDHVAPVRELMERVNPSPATRLAARLAETPQRAMQREDNLEAG